NRDDVEDIERSIVEYQSLMSEYILNREQYPFDNNMTQQEFIDTQKKLQNAKARKKSKNVIYNEMRKVYGGLNKELKRVLHQEKVESDIKAKKEKKSRIEKDKIKMEKQKRFENEFVKIAKVVMTAEDFKYIKGKVLKELESDISDYD